MSFAQPALLCLMVLPVLLALWEARRRGHEVSVPFDHGAQPEGRGLDRLLRGAGLLPAALAALAVLLLAGPRRPGPPGTEREMTNIEFCLDVSGSMTSPFGEGSQYDAAMAALRDFTSRRRRFELQSGNSRPPSPRRPLSRRERRRDCRRGGRLVERRRPSAGASGSDRLPGLRRCRLSAGVARLPARPAPPH